MPLITFITSDGDSIEAEATIGSSLMETAVDNDIEQILAECGGACACGTCHCYIDKTWMEVVGEADQQEVEMLNFALEMKKNSRLSCQINVTNDLHGLIVHLPKEQY